MTRRHGVYLHVRAPRFSLYLRSSEQCVTSDRVKGDLVTRVVVDGVVETRDRI